MKDKNEDWPASKITMRKTAELTPYANNSRVHSAQQVGQIAASINEWGFTNPVLIDEKGTIIAGHGRIMAAQKLGIEEVPTMTATGWTEAQKKAYVIADNQLALTSEWNSAVLISEIDEIAKFDFNVELIGFSEKDLAKLFDDVKGIEINEDTELENELEEIKVKFDASVKIDVINAVTDAVKNIISAEVWVGE